MQPVSHMIWNGAGALYQNTEHTQPGVCALCGVYGSGEPFARWVKSTFVDYDQLRHGGTVVCPACQYCTAEFAPGLGLLLGREREQRIRNYSHIITPDGAWHCLTPADKGRMFAMLTSTPCTAVIALTGQKHLVLRALPGWWQVETQRMLPDPEGLAFLMRHMQVLYEGCNKVEIETGNYTLRGIMRVGSERYKATEAAIRPKRGSLVFDLALWLLKKEQGNGE